MKRQHQWSSRMERDDQSDTVSLASLGIGHAVDTFGQQRLSIDLDLHPAFGVAQCRALFDPETRRWKLITTANAKMANGQPAIYSQHNSNDATNSRPPVRRGPSMWIDSLPDTPYVAYFKEVDWESTPLGPLQAWPVSLQLLVNVLLADSKAAVIYWGPERCGIYNQMMLEIVGERLRKSAMMGAPFADIWPELVTDFEPMFQSIAQSKVAIDTLDVNLFPERDGRVEETFFSGSFIPLRGESDRVEGFYNRASETTRETIRERRAATLNAIAAAPDARGRSVWEHVFEAFEENDRDFPAALLYSAEEDAASGGCILRLQKSFGIAETDANVPQEVDLYEGREGFMPFFRKAKAANRPFLLHRSGEVLFDAIVSGFLWQGFHEPSTSLAIIPIASGDRFLGVLTIGLNPRRPYDGEYEGFVNQFSRQVSNTISSVFDLELAHKREARLAAQLASSEKQIRDMAEFAPVGMCRIATNGLIMWANPQFYDISGHSRDAADHYELSFVDIVLEEDQPTSASLWPVLLDQREKVSVQLRMKRKWKPPVDADIPQESEEEAAWILALAYPIIEDDQVKAIAACITDISALKWAEAVQARSAVAAKEAKRMIERHVDLTSHEIRNPLSAITQCADGITSSQEELEAIEGEQTLEAAREIIQNNVDAAKIILLCAAHQRRIIDDVLTLSKLESTMLSITPVAIQPFAVVQSALKMFEAEFQSHNIEVQSIRETDYDVVDWVMLDPSRMTQIFVNLLTNAIKFTKLEKKCQITIRYGATRSRPPNLDGVHWFPTDALKKDLTQGAEWGCGEPIYMYFGVTDTGKGLADEEMMRLFNRFQQASPRTHIEYGGSGLGLFISRQLTELQGGEIGVKSKKGLGSTFAFFVKGRKAPTPSPSAEVTVDLSKKGPRRRSTLSNTASIPTDSAAKNPCVLLVEDNVVNAKVLSKQLQKAGCEVYLANHGVEAIDFLHKSKSWRGNTLEGANPELDVILMDVEMPVMDGLTCTRRIRQLEQDGALEKHIHIIAITANARSEQIASTMQAGVDDVMPKPFKVAELLAKMQHLTMKGLKRS